ncbi:MAG: diguanylate cyclase [Spirochaetales bacterium]|nr:diguanylate cyclase [Spirochaetales bacterium]
MMEKFPGYLLLEKIGEDRSSVVYKGQREDDALICIIKLLKTRHPSSSEIARFKREYDLIQTLGTDGVVRVVDIVGYNGSYAIVEEDSAGIPLREIIKTKNLNLESFLKIGLKLSETLGILHKNSIIHMAVKPDNILVNKDLHEVKLTNFGISSVLTHENDEIYDPEVIERALSYMSPEQTGRTNQRIDYRTDLYSLGITFYEMLLGKVPFEAKDPMELIYSHIARNLDSLDSIDPLIPPVISGIILKLLAKTPEERYQNSFGLMIDLEKCLSRLNNTGKIKSFPLGEKDISIKFNIPQIIVGRKEETKTLLSIFEGVTRGEEKRQITLVSGAPGIGKTAIINEIQKPIITKRGYFISGKYDLFRRDVPYSAIIQAFQGLVRQLLAESEERLNKWKDLIAGAVGPSGKIITDIIPIVEYIIGKQSDVPELNPEQSQNRFNLVFKKFVSIFAIREHPLVMFLDDLQWVDLASMAFIKTIVSDPDTKYLHFIGAYRDNEVSALHPFALAVEDIKKEGIKINTLNVTPLSVTHVNQLLVNFLGCTEERSFSLAEIIFQKTNGNPFFVNQFLKTLYDGSILDLSPTAGWTWDIERIKKLQVTDNVVELMAEKISKLSKGTQEIVKIGACIGNRFDIETMAFVAGLSIDETLNLLTMAIDEGLVAQFGDIYMFYHDRIQEAAYSLVPDDEKTKMHYKIGNFSLKSTMSHELYNKIIYIVDQLNCAESLIIEFEERNNLARLNLMAGRKAKASAAYESALTYYKAGISFLAQDFWKAQYHLALSLHEEAAEAEFFCTRFDNIAYYADEIKKHAKSPIDKLNVQTTIMRVLIACNKLQELVYFALDITNSFGWNIPKNPHKLTILFMFIKISIHLIGKRIEDLDKLPLKETLPAAFYNLYVLIGTPAFFFKPEVYVLIILTGVYQCVRGEGSDPAPIAYAYAGYGAILCSVLGDYESGYKFAQLALKMLKKPGTEKIKAKTILAVNYLIIHYKQHLKNTLQLLKDAFQIGLETGDLEHATLAAVLYIFYRFLTGQPLPDIKNEMKFYTKIMNQSGQEISTQFYELHGQVILNLMNCTEHPYDFTGEMYNEKERLSLYEKSNANSLIFNLYLLKITLFYLFAEYKQAVEYIALAKEYPDVKHSVYAVTLFNLYDSLSQLAIACNADQSIKKNILGAVSKNQKKMKRWARHAPMNYLHKYHLVEAEVARIKADDMHAMNLYHKAIQEAHDNEYLQEEALGYELAAKFYLSRGKNKIAATYMTEAYNCYYRWGAITKTKHLVENYPGLITRTESPNKQVYDTETSDPEEFLNSRLASGLLKTQALDLSTIIKTSLAISGEINLGRLLEIIMKLVIENAGAQKGFLILEKEDDKNLYIEAESIDGRGIEVLQSAPVEKSKKLSTAIVQYVKKTKEPLLLNDVTREGMFTRDSYVINNNPKSILCVPIQYKGKMIGILYLENNLAHNAFVPERVELLKLLSSQAAISIENAILYERAITDGLTGIYNKAFFDNYWMNTVERARQKKKRISLMMIDIDYFKSINDTYGHQFGDTVLKGVAKIIAKTSGEENLTARYGGEEFVVVLKEIGIDDAMIIAEKIRNTVEESFFEYVEGEIKKQVNVTVSIGLSPMTGNESRMELIERADRNLYLAKGKGRNRVE